MNDAIRSQIRPFCADSVVCGQFSSAASAERTAAFMQRIFERAAVFEQVGSTNMKPTRKPRQRKQQPAVSWIASGPIENRTRPLFLPRLLAPRGHWSTLSHVNKGQVA